MPIRLLCDPPQDGATNMAADEDLLASVGSGDSPPTLRLYRWGPAALSLGYFQRYADAQSHPILPDSLKVETYRRLTGGGAIIHDQEVTYSLTVPVDHALARGEPGLLYTRVHQVAIEAASILGLFASLRSDAEQRGQIEPQDTKAKDGEFLCFHRAHSFDVVAGGLKLMGSAQRRTRTAVLQHGSLMTYRRYHVQKCLTLSMLAGHVVTWEATVEAFIAAWPLVFADEPLVPGEWTDAELQARWETVKKHRSAAWIQKR